MRKPGAAPLDQLTLNQASADGAKLSLRVDLNCTLSKSTLRIPRLQRVNHIVEIFPGALPQAFAFCAFGAWSSRFFCYHPFVPATPFSNTVGLCKRCKRKLATLGGYCEPCFIAMVEAIDSDEPELDPNYEDDAPVIQLRNEES